MLAEDHTSGVDWDEATVAVALSGGGFRASLHGLGALMYLVDSGLNKNVSSIVSVSGGSITNAFVYSHCDFREVSSDEFDGLAVRFVRVITSQGLVPSWPVTGFLVLVSGLWLLSLIGLTSTWVGFWSAPASWAVFLLGWFGAVSLLLLRGHVLSYLLQRRLLGPAASDRPTRTAVGEGDEDEEDSSEERIEHAFAATDLNRGCPVFFTEDGQIYSEALEMWALCDAPLPVVVRASAAFPGGFPAKRMRVEHFGPAGFFAGLAGFLKPLNPSTLYLADGGVWNNLGTDWWADDTVFFRGRGGTLSKEAYHLTRRVDPAPDVRLVVNSGTHLQLSPSRWLVVPVIGEVLGLVRAMRTLYENTVTPRTRLLALLQQLPASVAEGEHRLRPSAVADLGQDPLQWAGRTVAGIPMHRGEVDRLRTRKQRVSRALVDAYVPASIAEYLHNFFAATVGEDDPMLNSMTRELFDSLKLAATGLAAHVPTTLGKVAPRDAVALLVHGYVSAMAGMHIVYGADLIKLPSPEALASRVGLQEVDCHLGLHDEATIVEQLSGHTFTYTPIERGYSVAFELGGNSSEWTMTRDSPDGPYEYKDGEVSLTLPWHRGSDDHESGDHYH